MPKGKSPCLHATRWSGVKGCRSTRAFASQVGHVGHAAKLMKAVSVQTELKRMMLGLFIHYTHK
jgi:hypothetical protein